MGDRPKKWWEESQEVYLTWPYMAYMAARWVFFSKKLTNEIKIDRFFILRRWAYQKELLAPTYNPTDN